MNTVDLAYSLLEAGEPAKALAELERGAEASDAASSLEAAVWYLDGRHVARDLTRSREYFRRAGDLGDATAEHVYIAFLANGVGGEGSWQAATERLRSLATRDERAARQVGLVEKMAIDADGYPAERPAGRQISDAPEAWAFDRFMSGEECAYLIEAAKPLLQPSVVVDPHSGALRPHPIRTSDGASFPWVSEDLVISALNRRIAVASETELACGEPLQVLRYRPGQQYRPHLDALPPGENQRVLTMLVYLNSDYSGGETHFTRTGLTFSGGMGDALLFRNADPGRPPDPKAEHAGLAVREGEKFVASRWIRERSIVAA